MKQFLLASLTFSLMALPNAGSANTVYPINLSVTTSNPTGNPAQSDTITGSITTDGTIGTLASSNILGWNLNLFDNLNSAYDYDLTPSNSSLVEDTGSALSATSTGLYFDYSGAGEFLIQANAPGAYSGYHYFCFSTGGACLTGETIAPDYIYTDGVVLTGTSAPVGTQPLNSGSTASTTPEPVSLSLMSVGLVVAGVARVRLRR
jgi:hypothetical protein